MVKEKNIKDMLGRSNLLLVNKALDILIDHLKDIKLDTEHIPLLQAFDRILAVPITAPTDLPALARSTMDGFAVRAVDTFGASESMPCYLQITGEVQIDEMPTGEVKKGCCYAIPTGGLLPRGADSVVMFEHTISVDSTMVEIITSVAAGTHLMQRGEDIALGTMALTAPHLLRPQDIGLLAGLGIAEVTVTKKPRIGILSTGDEIIAHTETPQPGQIRNINSLTFTGLIQRMNCLYSDYGIVSDNEEVFFNTLKKAIEENDIVIFSGGSSVGLQDLGEQVVDRLGPPGVIVHGVALKPGKPILIGLSGSTPVFGLPGHPVSAMVCFEFFVRPTIEKLSAKSYRHNFPTPSVTASLSRNINSAPGRLDVVRVRLTRDGDSWRAEPILGKSGAISTLSRANGYFIIDEDSQGITENSAIKVQLLQ